MLTCQGCIYVKYCGTRCLEKDSEHKKFCMKFQLATRQFEASRSLFREGLRSFEFFQNVLDLGMIPFREGEFNRNYLAYENALQIFNILQNGPNQHKNFMVWGKCRRYHSALVATHLNLGNLDEAMKYTHYNAIVHDDCLEGIENVEVTDENEYNELYTGDWEDAKVDVEHVAVAILKWDLTERGKIDYNPKIDAFKSVLLTFRAGTPQARIIRNYEVMLEIEKFVRIVDPAAAKEECKHVIREALKAGSFYEGPASHWGYHDRRKADQKDFMLKRFFDRMDKKKEIDDYMEMRKDAWEREMKRKTAFDNHFHVQFLKKYLEWRNNFFLKSFLRKFVKKGKKKLSKREIPILDEQILKKYLQWRNDPGANPCILKGIEFGNPGLLKSTLFDSDELQILYHIEEDKYGKYDKLDTTDEIDESDESEDWEDLDKSFESYDFSDDDFDYENFNFGYESYDSDGRNSGFFNFFGCYPWEYDHDMY